MIDGPTLDALFADLEACAEILAVIPKAGPGYVSPRTISLQAGRNQFAAGQLRGLQVRYRFQGTEWWDTLLPEADGARVTRIKPCQ